MNNRAARFLGGLLVWPLGVLAADSAPDAKQIMAAVFRQTDGRDIFMRANFEVFDKTGHSTKKYFSYGRIGRYGDSKTLLEFTDPQELRGVALLSIKAQPDSQFLYVPATQRVRTLQPGQSAARFVGTDFTFDDFAENRLEDFSYQLTGDTALVDGRNTLKLVATPTDAARSPFRAVYFWVATDAPVVVRATMLDAQGRAVRELHATQIMREAGIWGARRLEMRSLLEGTRTVLNIREVHFNKRLDAKRFTPERLGSRFDDGVFP